MGDLWSNNITSNGGETLITPTYLANTINLSQPMTRSKAVVLLLIAAPFVLRGGCAWVCVWSLFCCAVLCVHSGYAIILLGKRQQVALLPLPFDVLWLLVFYVSYSWCHRLVWRVWLCHVLTYSFSFKWVAVSSVHLWYRYFYCCLWLTNFSFDRPWPAIGTSGWRLMPLLCQWAYCLTVTVFEAKFSETSFIYCTYRGTI